MNLRSKMRLYFFIIIFFLTHIPDARSQSLEEQAVAIRKEIEAGPPQFSLIGELQKGQSADYSVNGEDFVIDAETRVTGELRVGRSVMVRGQRLGNRNYAKKIFVQEKRASNNTPSVSTPEEVQMNSRGPALLPGTNSKID